MSNETETTKKRRLVVPASQNPWYVLATLAGEQQGEVFDRNLQMDNLRYWNAWARQRMTAEEIEKLNEAAGWDVFEDVPSWAEVKGEVERLFTARLPRTPLPKPTQRVDFMGVEFPGTVSFERFVFPSDVNFYSATFSGEAFFYSLKADCRFFPLKSSELLAPPRYSRLLCDLLPFFGRKRLCTCLAANQITLALSLSFRGRRDSHRLHPSVPTRPWPAQSVSVEIGSLTWARG